MSVPSAPPPSLLKVFLVAVSIRILLGFLSPPAVPIELQTLEFAISLGMTASFFHVLAFAYGYLQVPKLILHILVLCLGFALAGFFMNFVVGGMTFLTSVVALVVHLTVLALAYHFVVKKIKSKKP